MMLTCRDATALASRAMDGPLPWPLRLSLWIHLAMCGYCSRYQRQLRFLRLAASTADVAETRAESLSAPAKERMRSRIRDSMSGG